MNVWIDITNSPHVNFFADLIRELSDEHQILLTCRPLANTIDLLELQGFEHEVVGRHYGRNKLRKIGGFFARCAALYRTLRSRPIDVAISHSSFYSPLVARALGVPCIYLNDNEHAEGNRLAFLFAQHILVPEFLSDDALRRQWAKESKVTRYPGVKEGIYLWQLAEGAPVPAARRPERPLIIVRPEPWAAQYYSGGRDFLDELLLGLRDLGKVLLLPRGEEQAAHYRDARFAGIEIPATPLSLSDFQRTCDLFVGAGGTMTREAAVLGIPTISIYQDELLAVDRYLVECGAMVHNPHADLDFIASILSGTARRAPDTELLQKGKCAYELIKATLYAAARGVEERSQC